MIGARADSRKDISIRFCGGGVKMDEMRGCGPEHLKLVVEHGCVRSTSRSA